MFHFKNTEDFGMLAYCVRKQIFAQKRNALLATSHFFDLASKFVAIFSEVFEIKINK